MRSWWLVVTLVVTACVGAGPTQSSGPTAEPYGELPLTALETDGAAIAKLMSARENELAWQCMRREGFDDPPPPTLSREQVLADEIETPELTVERARQFGYRWWLEFGNGTEEEATLEQFDAYLEGLGEEGRAAWAMAYFGSEEDRISIDTAIGRLTTSATGCLAEARARIAGDVATHLEWSAAGTNLADLRNQALDLTESDPQVRDALDRWQRCMREAGYNVADFQEAAEVAAYGKTVDRLSAEELADMAPEYNEEAGPTDREIEIAVTDAECRRASGYHQVFRERRSAYENQVLAEHEVIIFAWHEAADAMRAAIADLIVQLDLTDELDGALGQ